MPTLHTVYLVLMNGGQYNETILAPNRQIAAEALAMAKGYSKTCIYSACVGGELLNPLDCGWR